MGLLVNGQWHDQWYDTKKSGGEFVREESGFRDSIDDSPDARFAPEAGRYHLYVSLACPWAHRVLIFRKLKQLESLISVSVTHPDMLKQGWQYSSDYPGATDDPINNAQFQWQVYTAAKPDYTGRVTVPVLWDKKENTIVNNESAELIRMFNSAFNRLTGNALDFYPTALRKEIDDINHQVYHHVNNGVYKSGFATTQKAYEKNVTRLFNTLDELEQRLSQQRYLVGQQITEADWRLFTTLIRFDSVYFGHFKCNLRSIDSYPNLREYLRELYQYPGIADTVNFDHIKRHYYFSHDTINPHRIIPLGPDIDYNQPHRRQEQCPL